MRGCHIRPKQHQNRDTTKRNTRTSKQINSFTCNFDIYNHNIYVIVGKIVWTDSPTSVYTPLPTVVAFIYILDNVDRDKRYIDIMD